VGIAPRGLSAKNGDNACNSNLKKRFTMRGNVAAIVLVTLGAFFLLSNLGLINVSLAELFKTWWPVILIAVGLSMFALPNDRKKE
jgi:hypothetical protein